MKKTIICHFFNEEYLLPWWLTHHKQFFDHGILIDYHSPDINKICPEWTVIQTSNQYFDSTAIDIEISKIESNIDGWRTCLNITEFLIGDYNLLDDTPNKQILVGNCIFVDNDAQNLNHNLPLYNQIYNGYHGNASDASKLGLGDRTLRSIHNINIMYPQQGGRHFYGKASTDNLMIFYYGYLLNNDMINRKIQIKNKMSTQEIKRLKQFPAHPNLVSSETFVSKILKYQLPRCKNIKSKVDKLLSLQNKCI
jgi:hypothetical protein